MNKYRFTEHNIGYKYGQTLRAWRPQFPVFYSLIGSNEKVLDVGCGDGVMGEKLIKEKKCEVFGIDLDIEGVREAKRRGLKAEVGDADDGLRYKDNYFDIVLCNGLLEFVRKPDFVVSEMFRVGKRVIVEFENFGFWFYRLEYLVLGKFPRFALYGHRWWETGFGRFFSLSDFLALPAMKDAQVKSVTCINWRNRKVSILSRINPNFFGRSCILETEKK